MVDRTRFAGTALSVLLAIAVSPLRADVALTVATPGTTVNTSSGSSYVNVPIDVDLTNSGSMQALTLVFSYNSSLLSIAASNVTVGSIGAGWTPTVNANTPGTLVVVQGAASYVQANLQTSILNMDFLVNHGDSGFVPIMFIPPTTGSNAVQQVYDKNGNNLPQTNPLTTTFTNGGINTSNVPSGPAIWTSMLSGSWSTTTNWSNGPPTLAGEQPVFAGSSATNLTVTLDGPDIAGGLSFGNSAGNSTNYLLAPAGSTTGTLTLNNTGSTVPLQVLGGSDSISAPITLAGNIAISESAGSTLAISGNIGQSAPASLALSGPGLLILSGTNSYSGGTIVSGGTLDLATDGALPSGRSLTIGAGGQLEFGAGPFAGLVSPDDSMSAAGAAQPSHASVEPVPEPGTFVLAVAGLMVAGLAWRASPNGPRAALQSSRGEE